MCFEIFGFDIMFDENLKVYLLEVNHTPSFSTDTPLDYNIKKCLILDTLILVNTRIKDKK
jgi:tubulin polyglutamylase TTLL6/13